MENNTIEMALLEPEEREMVEFIFSAIPAADRGSLTADFLCLTPWMISSRNKAW